MLSKKLRIKLNLLQEELPTIMNNIINDDIAIQNFKQNGEYTYSLEDGTVTSLPNDYKTIVKLVQNDIVEFICYIIHYALDTSPNDCILVMFTYHFDKGWQKLTAYPLLIINNELTKIGDSWQDPKAISYPPRHPSLDTDCSCP